MRLAVVVLLLAGASSGQMLFSLQRLGEPRSLLHLPTITLVRDPAPPAAAPDYKQQVQQRNAECYQQCTKEFETAEGSAAACERGCRLFALAEATEPKLAAGEHRDKCTKDCETAYPVLVEQHSCQTGCRHQRPKEQDEEGAPVVMSVVRKFTFDTDGGQEVRRSQSSVLVHDGDKMRVIEGPAQVTVTRHDEKDGQFSSFPSALDEMVQRMHQTMRRMMLRMRGFGEEKPESPEEHHQTESRHVAQVSPGVQPAPSGWLRVWRCTPHYVVLAVLLLGTALVLYSCYCLVCVVRRRRRQEGLIEHEEVAQDLPPKYTLAAEETETTKAAEAKEPPPAYAAIVTDAELPPKLDV